MNNKKCHIFVTVPKSNQKDEIYIVNAHIHGMSLSWLGTGTYQKVTGLKKREILLFRVHDSFRE